MRAIILRALVLSVATVGFGCSGEIDNLPTTPDPVIVTDTFTGTININGAATHNVFTTATGNVTARLTSLGDNPPSKIGLALGTLASGGTVCNVVVANDNAVVTTEVVGTVQSLAGSLCARIYDVGSLTESVSYTFTVTHP
jgi:hypothetical protein